MVNKNMIIGAVALVALAAIVLMGMAVVEGFSKEFRDDSGLTNATVTLGAVNVSTDVGTTSQYGYLQSLGSCTNDTLIIYEDQNYTWTEGDADGGTITLLDNIGAEWPTDQVNCTITYLTDSTMQGHADNFSTGLGIFGAFIGVLVIAVLGLFIMNLFRRKED